MKPKKYIVDTTLRDGEQSPGIAMNTAQKIKAALILDSYGVAVIEAGILAIGNVETEAVKEIVRLRKNSAVSVWCRLSEEDIKLAGLCNCDMIHLSMPVSYKQIYYKLGKNKAWVMKNLAVCVELAHSLGINVTVGFEDASRADITFMKTVVEQLLKFGVKRIRFADTVGILTPSRCSEAIADLKGAGDIEIEFHAHNDLGMAVANSIAAFNAGADYIDTTVFGIGERSGNCDFLKFITAAGRIADFGITPADAREIECRFREIINTGDYT